MEVVMIADISVYGQIAKEKEKKLVFGSNLILQCLLKSLICWYVNGNGMYGFQTGD